MGAPLGSTEIVLVRQALEVFVRGTARPAGSKRVFAFVGKDGRPHARVVDSSDRPVEGEQGRGKSWRSDVQDAVLREWGDRPPLDGPLRVEMTFFIARPKGHYGSGRNASILKLSAPRYPTSKPDTTKLVRAAEDALKGVLWRDDSQVVEQANSKRYATGHVGLRLRVLRM